MSKSHVNRKCEVWRCCFLNAVQLVTIFRIVENRQERTVRLLKLAVPIRCVLFFPYSPQLLVWDTAFLRPHYYALPCARIDLIIILQLMSSYLPVGRTDHMWLRCCLTAFLRSPLHKDYSISWDNLFYSLFFINPCPLLFGSGVARSIDAWARNDNTCPWHKLQTLKKSNF
jgi:hypothetical protein